MCSMKTDTCLLNYHNPFIPILMEFFEIWQKFHIFRQYLLNLIYQTNHSSNSPLFLRKSIAKTAASLLFL